MGRSMGDYRKALFRAEHSGQLPDGWVHVFRKTRTRLEPYVLSLILTTT